jgi:hypothetical protein
MDSSDVTRTSREKTSFLPTSRGKIRHNIIIIASGCCNKNQAPMSLSSVIYKKRFLKGSLSLSIQQQQQQQQQTRLSELLAVTFH